MGTTINLYIVVNITKHAENIYNTAQYYTLTKHI